MRQAMATEAEARRAVIAKARAMNALGLNEGTAGNVSVRQGDAMLITPSGAPYDSLTPAKIARMVLDGAGAWTGPLKPSSEWRFHLDIYRARPDAGAIVHTHATHCTAFAMLRRPLRATHYMIAAFGGPDVRCTDYAPYGTEALSTLAVEGLRDRNAVLLGSHGMIVIGRDADEALWRAVELETLARQTFIASQMGEPVVLPDDEITRTVERFKGYGLNATREKPRVARTGASPSGGRKTRR
jgi:L-fuculose-phosphate aldolase